jgi:bacteriorhodopsin
VLGLFTFSCVAFFFVGFTVVWEGRAYARVMGADILRNYNIIAAWTVLLWMCYPIIWGVSEGGNVIAPDSEAVSYGVLDILSKRECLPLPLRPAWG